VQHSSKVTAEADEDTGMSTGGAQDKDGGDQKPRPRRGAVSAEVYKEEDIKNYVKKVKHLRIFLHARVIVILVFRNVDLMG